MEIGGERERKTRGKGEKVKRSNVTFRKKRWGADRFLNIVADRHLYIQV